MFDMFYRFDLQLFAEAGTVTNTTTGTVNSYTGAVNTTDAMSATIEEIPYALLHRITDRITAEVEGINRVLYDLTPKPIGTIEWE